jgi:hypothetical protein
MTVRVRPGIPARWDVAQLAVAPDFESGGRRFDPFRPSQFRLFSSDGLERRAHNARVPGSNPGRATKFALEAHQDEHATLNREAAGSIPAGRTSIGSLPPVEVELAFKQYAVGSNPTRPTKRFSRRCLLKARMRPFQGCDAVSRSASATMPRSSNGSGQNATNVQIPVRIWSGVPNLRARLLAARMEHCLCFDGGSIPLVPANVSTM